MIGEISVGVILYIFSYETKTNIESRKLPVVRVSECQIGLGLLPYNGADRGKQEITFVSV